MKNSNHQPEIKPKKKFVTLSELSRLFLCASALPLFLLFRNTELIFLISGLIGAGFGIASVITAFLGVKEKKKNIFVILFDIFILLPVHGFVLFWALT